MTQSAPGATALVSDVAYHLVDDTTLMVEIIRPDPVPAAPMPAIIYIHGGAWMYGDRTVNRNAFLAAQGFFTVSIDYRSSLQAIFPAQLDDAKTAVRWLRSHAAQYHIDPQRIGIWGHSAGAHLAALVGVSGHLPAIAETIGPNEPSSRVQAVATLACPTDFLQMGGWHEAPDSPEAQLVGGPIRERVNVVHMANPITYVQPAAPPFLLMHGECDEIVPIAQSELLAHALRAAGNAVTLIAIPDAGHNFGEDEASWAEAQRQVVAFFRKELQL
ncbi:MAG: alpha/beta hydrolase [Kouleothrix sp.]|nr:alpha/beta hydrolase [Kouleothrix sp.]